MYKKEKQKQLLNYFLHINHLQTQIQTIQNKLIVHVRFNPLFIYKSITQGHPYLTLLLFVEYAKDQLKIKEADLAKKYFQKYFNHQTVSLEEFSDSLLPYTPNVLRQATFKIDKQMETRHYDRLIEQLYHQLLLTEFRAIHEICLLQKDLNMDWTHLKLFIQKEVLELGRKIDYEMEDCSIIMIRKWMQLWIDVDEYKVLNIMRWFGGHQEKDIRRIYQNNQTHLKCTCDHSKHMADSNSKVKQSSSRLTKAKSQQRLIKAPKHYLKLFLKYTETIIKSERRLNILREGLQQHRRQIQLILHEITSKETHTTKLGKTIEQMHSVLNLKEDVFETLMRELEHIRIDNNLIFSLFVSPKKHSKQHIHIKKQDLMTEVYEVLYTFCLSKVTLKSIAKELHEGVELLFSQLDENNHGYIDRTDLRLILNQASIKFKESDLKILMNHFGHQQLINMATLKEVIILQKSK